MQDKFKASYAVRALDPALKGEVCRALITPIATAATHSVAQHPSKSLIECYEQLVIDMLHDAPALVTLKRWSGAGKLNTAKVKGIGAKVATAKRARFHYDRVLEIAQAAQRTRAPRIAPYAPLDRRHSGQDQAGQSVARSDADNHAATVPENLLAYPTHPISALDTGRIIGMGVDSAQGHPPPARQTDQCPMSAQSLSMQISDNIADDLKPLVHAALASVQAQLVDALDNLDATRKMLMLKYDSEMQTLRAKVADLQNQNTLLKAASADSAKINIQLSKLNDAVNLLANR